MAGTSRRAAPSRARRATRGTSSSRAASSSTAGRTTKKRFFDYPRSGYTGLHRWLPSWRVILGTFITFVFLGVGAFIGLYQFTEMPDALAEAQFETTTIYYAGAEPGEPGEVLGQFAEQRRELVDYTTLPDYVGRAVAAGENRTFYSDRGISITGMLRAFVNNAQGGQTQGASTLTQQYVERYYMNTTKDYLGKAQEAILALKLTQTESKDQIMGRYLNTIYYGRDSYGIETAAQSYFGKGAADLTVAEAAVIAALIPSPNNWDPAVNPEKNEQRWNIILDAMVEEGWLDATERAGLEYPQTVTYERSQTYAGPNGYLLEMVKNELINSGKLTEEQLSTGGLQIVTTIEKDVQDQAVASAAALISGEMSDGETPSENMKIGITSIDPANGAIVAMYGGADYLSDFSNRSLAAIQAGSTFKPFALVAGLENGVSLSTTFDGNSPQRFPEWENGQKDVNNFGNQSFGTIDLVDATANSVNTVYAALNIQVGPAKTAEVAKRAGAKDEPLQYPSNVLGSDEVRPLDMASAYATFAAQGVHYDTYIVQKVTWPEGDVAYTGGSTAEQVFDADVMADTTYAMTQVVERGSGAGWVKPLGVPVAGKTGTSTSNKSAWFVGFTPTIATAVALSQVGEDGASKETITPFGRSAGGTVLTEVTGSTWPAALWARYMGPVLDIPKYAAVRDFPERANVGHTPTPTAAPTQTVEPTQEPTEEAVTETQVPGNLVGRMSGDAESAVINAGLVPSVRTEESETVPEGLVIRVEPGSGTTLETGQTVTIVVSSGAPEPEWTPEPDPTPTPTPTPSQSPTPSPTPVDEEDDGQWNNAP